MSQTDRSFKYLTHTVHEEAQRAAIQAFTLQSGLQIDATVKIALRTAVDAAIVSMTESPTDQMVVTYVVWSNEHKCWWGPNHAGYYSRLKDAGRYTRDEALKICVNARGGRQFNSNPSEVPLPLEDAERFWPDDKEEWRVARLKHEHPELWEEEDGY